MNKCEILKQDKKCLLFAILIKNVLFMFFISSIKNVSEIIQIYNWERRLGNEEEKKGVSLILIIFFAKTYNFSFSSVINLSIKPLCPEDETKQELHLFVAI